MARSQSYERFAKSAASPFPSVKPRQETTDRTIARRATLSGVGGSPKSVSSVSSPSRKLMWLVFRGSFGTQVEGFGDFGGFGEHHAGFAGDGDELEALGEAALGGGGVNDVDAGGNFVF